MAISQDGGERSEPTIPAVHRLAESRRVFRYIRCGQGVLGRMPERHAWAGDCLDAIKPLQGERNAD